MSGFVQSLNLLTRIRPDAVIAFGAYVSLPVLLAAKLRGMRFYLLEQNRVPGRVVRFFAPYARNTFLTFPLHKPIRAPITLTGTPLRQELVQNALKFSYPPQPQPQPFPKTVLVLGGTQGARPLNLAAVDMAAQLTNLHFIVLTGRRDYKQLKSLVHSANCQLIEWTDHPEDLYQQAHLAVTRGGGLVLSELLAFGIPAIIVPFPYALDNHQDANALYLEQTGAAVRLEQTQLSGLIPLVRTLTLDDARLKRMSVSARKLARFDAASTIARTILHDLGL